jgi:hypothetical protein
MSEHKLLGAMAVVAVSLACGPVAPTEGELGRAPRVLQGGSVDRDDRAVVGIVARRASGGQICSGVLIAPNVVLTAAALRRSFISGGGAMRASIHRFQRARRRARRHDDSYDGQ